MQGSKRKYVCAMFDNKEYLRDKGCEFYGKCLDCPYPICLYELPPSRRAIFQKPKPTLFEYAEAVRR